MSHQVATEILNQLGGAGRLKVMLGVKSFGATESSLSFAFRAAGRNSIKAVRVVLDASDTYTVEFFRASGVTVDKFDGVYVDALRSCIEQRTGLYLSL